jgi:hypothetical protein
MAFNYYRSTWCGSAAANKNNEEIEACAVLVATLRKKRRWGGSVVGHKMKNRDRIGGDIQLNNDYFIERSLFNPEQFRRRYIANTILILLLSMLNYIIKNSVPDIVSSMTASSGSVCNNPFSWRLKINWQLQISSLDKKEMQLVCWDSPVDKSVLWLCRCWLMEVQQIF